MAENILGLSDRQKTSRLQSLKILDFWIVDFLDIVWGVQELLFWLVFTDGFIEKNLNGC